jgi:hypothetical protein
MARILLFLTRSDRQVGREAQWRALRNRARRRSLGGRVPRAVPCGLPTGAPSPRDERALQGLGAESAGLPGGHVR